MTTSLVPFGTRYPHLFDDFRREMDQVMNRFFTQGERSCEYYSPLCNVAELENRYEITVDLPGVDPKDVHVELRHGELWITGERPEHAQREGWTWHRWECPYGRFQRVIQLGYEVDADNINAEYDDGVLQITVPKVESAKTKHITIRS